MRKIIINDNQRGFLFKNGKYEKMLTAGKYNLSRNMEVEIARLDAAIAPKHCTLDTLLADKAVSQYLDVIEVLDMQIALHYVNGVFESILKSGRHAFWNIHQNHRFTIVDISDPMMNGKVPEHIFSRIANIYYTKVEIADSGCRYILFLEERHQGRCWYR